jgi:hypothetical protein
MIFVWGYAMGIAFLIPEYFTEDETFDWGNSH